MWQGLHIRLALIVGCVALLLAAVSSAVIYQRSYAVELDESERAVHQLLAAVQATASIAAYVRNTEMAYEVVSGLLRNDLVLAARITDGRDFDVSAGQFAGSHPDRLISLALEAPLTAGERVGEVAVLPDLDGIRARANASAREASIILAGQTILVACVVLAAVYLLLTRPMVRVTRALHDIVPGEKGRLRVPSGRRADELRVLVGDINNLLDTVADMLAQERALRERVESLEQRFRGIFESTSAGIFLFRETGALVTANPAFYRTVALAEADLIASGTDCLARIFADTEIVQAMIGAVIAGRRPRSADLRLRRVDGDAPVWVHALFSPGTNTGDAQLIEGVIYDITERRRTEDSTRKQAEHDSLTGLPNRRSAELHTASLLAQAAARGEALTFVLLDLDRFKQINDTHGHDAGDRVLIEVSRRMRAVVRDMDFVARIGGDEFLLLLPQTNRREAIERLGAELVRRIAEPVEVAPGVRDSVGASIGVAFCPQHGTDPESLRAHADTAMYAMKRAGRGGFAIFAVDGQHEVHSGGVA